MVTLVYNYSIHPTLWKLRFLNNNVVNITQQELKPIRMLHWYLTWSFSISSWFANCTASCRVWWVEVPSKAYWNL